MDSQEVTLLINNSREKFKTRVPILLMIVLWSLGIIDWSPPTCESLYLYCPIIGRSRLHRKITFVVSIGWLFTMALTAYFGALTYFICFFGLKEHFLRFVIVVVCYYPSLMSGTMFYIPAFFSNRCKKSEIDEFNMSWVNLFKESAFLQRINYIKKFNMFILPRLAVYVFFNICSLAVSFVILILYIEVYNDCLTWVSYIWTASEFIGLIYLAQFCYFLYLQRVSLEEEFKESECFIKANAGKLENCTQKVKNLFCNYFQLRKLFLLWLSIIFFSITFGIAAYATWSYKKPEIRTNSTVLPTQYPLHPKGIKKYCPYSCDDPKYFENQHHLLIYNVLAFAKLLIPAVLSFSVMRGLDIKYMWNRFILRLRLMSTTDHLDFWNTFIRYTKDLHPENQLDTKLRFIIPVLGLAFGFLGGWKSHE
ncbi:hypothetical protein HOLleu_40212 [Holothuria leucospilota]|uniref:Uncharacterized protein n=1 Tax=Holothuria leucospilota TaxID=206669 RepID=A0A9Q1BDG1_HOLLE|nr:hypothetical protein HOLleu_40212 [Holothuria leucospilota]